MSAWIDALPEPFYVLKRREELPLELRVWQRDDGAWDAMIRTKEFSRDYGDLGIIRFMGIAATESRAKALARDALATLVRQDAEWRADYGRRERERTGR